jgi:hypothetical protein
MLQLSFLAPSLQQSNHVPWPLDKSNALDDHRGEGGPDSHNVKSLSGVVMINVGLNNKAKIMLHLTRF